MTSSLEHLAVGDPVAVLELDPRRREEVEERDLLHRLAAGEQLAADQARVRRTAVSSSVGRRIAELATLRGKRVPAAPSFGLARLFHEPSAVRKWVTPSGGVGPTGEADVSVRRVGVEVVAVELLAHVREREDAGVQRLAVPVRPHPAAVAGDPTPHG